MPQQVKDSEDSKPEQCLDDVDGAMISALNPLKKADFLVAKATVAGMLIILICNVGMLIVFFCYV